MDCLFNIVEVFRATPSKKITTMGGIWYGITNLKPKIIECLKKFQPVKVFITLEGSLQNQKKEIVRLLRT